MYCNIRYQPFCLTLFTLTNIWRLCPLSGIILLIVNMVNVRLILWNKLYTYLTLFKLKFTCLCIINLNTLYSLICDSSFFFFYLIMGLYCRCIDAHCFEQILLSHCSRFVFSLIEWYCFKRSYRLYYALYDPFRHIGFTQIWKNNYVRQIIKGMILCFELATDKFI